MTSLREGAMADAGVSWRLASFRARAWLCATAMLVPPLGLPMRVAHAQLPPPAGIAPAPAGAVAPAVSSQDLYTASQLELVAGPDRSLSGYAADAGADGRHLAAADHRSGAMGCHSVQCRAAGRRAGNGVAVLHVGSGGEVAGAVPGGPEDHERPDRLDPADRLRFFASAGGCAGLDPASAGAGADGRHADHQPAAGGQHRQRRDMHPAGHPECGLCAGL